MDENLLHYIWKHRLYSTASLETCDGEPVEIISPGMQNMNAGADFFNAKIKIGSTVWAGYVEIHIRSSDWFLHKHDVDAAYNNVVLHVVAVNDAQALRQNGSAIPTLVLPFNKKMIDNYAALAQNVLWIPCEKYFPNIDPSLISLWRDALLLERLERKSDVVNVLMSETNNDFDEVFYRLLSKNMGFKTNAQPFEQLSRLVPLRVIRSLGDNVQRIEALLFGAAGFLSDTHSSYQEELKKEFLHLSHKFSISPLDISVWKFARMRPLSFPTIRIAQLSKMLSLNTQFVQKLKNAQTIEEVRSLFRVTSSLFWANRYTFENTSAYKEKAIGESSVDNIIINTVFPFLFVLGKYFDAQGIQQKSFNWMENIPCEKNSIIVKWRKLGAQIYSASDSQAFLELYNQYCNKSRCLECRLGGYIIREM